jgi:hypothetical protein
MHACMNAYWQGIQDLVKEKGVLESARDKLGLEKKADAADVLEKIKNIMGYVHMCVSPSLFVCVYVCSPQRMTFLSVSLARTHTLSRALSLFRDDNLSVQDAVARAFTKDDLSAYAIKHGKSGNGRCV